ncbi:glycosyl transferase [Ahrensia sp. R2A130]|nr:glycosyl transferase [Ahrensia sp. R2A130]
MQPPTVSIGVPVYNGEEDLQKSLDCLLRQTHTDFKVLLSDNASTDGTSEICAAMAAQDSRFTHVFHETNLGMSGNFRYALTEAPASDLFMWRAHDDVTSDDYLERLVALHANDPATRLAVGRVKTLKMYTDGRLKHERWRRMPSALNSSTSVRALNDRMFSLHESSYYGVWHRETLLGLFDRIYAAFPHPWAADHLTLLALSLDGTIRGDRNAIFTQRLLRHNDDQAPVEHDPQRSVASVSMEELHIQAGAVYDALVDEREWSILQRAALSAVRKRWLTKRVGKTSASKRSGLRKAISQLNRARKNR